MLILNVHPCLRVSTGSYACSHDFAYMQTPATCHFPGPDLSRPSLFLLHSNPNLYPNLHVQSIHINGDPSHLTCYIVWKVFEPGATVCQNMCDMRDKCLPVATNDGYQGLLQQAGCGCAPQERWKCGECGCCVYIVYWGCEYVLVRCHFPSLAFMH